jgi:predicted nucleotidyltransferase
MKETIAKALERIEKEQCVKIILASESGSRAWGFPSRDSDYDVRFVYVNQKDWYLSIADRRDVIELPVDEVLDINGWDLKKALRLMRKSNSPLLEWLSSPIRYRLWPEAFEKLTALSRLAFLPETACHHYLAMAKRSVERFGGNERVRPKTYMYAIRPVLCCQWIIDHRKQPPMHIDPLLAEIKNAQTFKDEVIRLIDRKKTQTEKDTVRRSGVIEDYINRKIIELPDLIPRNARKPACDLFDDAFRSILANHSTEHENRHAAIHHQ